MGFPDEVLAQARKIKFGSMWGHVKAHPQLALGAGAFVAGGMFSGNNNGIGGFASAGFGTALAALGGAALGGSKWGAKGMYIGAGLGAIGAMGANRMSADSGLGRFAVGAAIGAGSLYGMHKGGWLKKGRLLQDQLMRRANKGFEGMPNILNKYEKSIMSGFNKAGDIFREGYSPSALTYGAAAVASGAGFGLLGGR